jgi:tRNA uridine 5-carboxymethylaminomethyl modification enzyme
VKQSGFDVLVVGGGHAGTEAVLAAARIGARAALVTQRRDRLGEMSCNPAIGGVGKGHLVREIDALGGLMGRAADHAAIQYRLLNRSKGPAVRGPRVQADRALYRQIVQAEFERPWAPAVIAGECADLIVESGRVAGLVLADGTRIGARCVVLATGTFLGGVIHIGKEQAPAGRVGDAPAVALAARLRAMQLPISRLKTGTPPRLDGRTIRWDALETQAGDAEPSFMSFSTREIRNRQVNCAITWTNPATHDIIRENLGKSAVYSGGISGPGPRYCPSIEDKVVRFADKTSHQIFLEPEGLGDSTVYPNGISTSLPAEIQTAYVRSITGLEEAKIIRPGYAVEYDFVDPRGLSPGLERREIPGLYFAGQINGTTGYEEAAAQGLVAGANAALSALGAEPLILDRTDSYIGVLIDDLATKGVTEPYRMFTSRAEFRLSLGADSADLRLTPRGVRAGLVRGHQARAFDTRRESIETARTIAAACRLTAAEARSQGLDCGQDGVDRNVFDLLKLPNASWDVLRRIFPELASVPADVAACIEAEARYAPYLERQDRDAEILKQNGKVAIPPDLVYSALPGLSVELQNRLTRVRPSSMAQALQMEGMTPAAAVLILAQIRRATARAA